MSKWRDIKSEQTYTEEQIKERLSEELPAWYYENGWIRRKYRTHGWKATLMVVKHYRSSVRSSIPSPRLDSVVCLCRLQADESRGKGRYQQGL